MVVNINSRRANKRFYPIAFDIYKTISLWQLWDVMIWYIPKRFTAAQSLHEPSL
jgi:hypothetical protein